MLSVNEKACELVKELCASSAEYGVSIEKTKIGATVIDAGVETKGGFEAGRLITEICMGGLGKARISSKTYGRFQIPEIFVSTEHPAVATLGSQFAGWQIRVGDFFAIGSGPARALALKPPDVFDRIKYVDEAVDAVLVLEASKKPPEDLLVELSRDCNVSSAHLYVILVPTTSTAGSVQVSGRIVETGLNKLSKLGVDPLSVQYAWGCAPIAPAHPKLAEAMGRTNDAILYGGVAYYALRHGDDGELKALLEKAPSVASEQYGKPFRVIFEEADCDFYKIDPNLFAPAVFVVSNLATGRVFQVGEINVQVLTESLGLRLLH
jgi:methenyltetrahydromethanopterin cyclohydrolase